jgi:hypothetical protein
VTAVAALVWAGHVTDFAGQLIGVDTVFRYLALIGICLLVAFQAIDAWSALVTLGVFGAVPVVMACLVALEAGHPFLQPMDASLDALVLALVFIGHTGTVASQASVLDRRNFLDFVLLY